MNEQVLVSDYVHPSLIRGLEAKGYEVLYRRDFPPEELESVLGQLTGIVINTKMKMTRERIEMADRLRFIARLGSGLDIIDLEAAEERGITVINTPEGNRNAVAEHAIGMMLALSNKLVRADRELRQKLWRREANRGFELQGKTIGIVGMGNTGRSLAGKLSCWGLEMFYHDPYIPELDSHYSYLKSGSLEELASRSDIISLHVQLTEETRHLVDDRFLSRCRQGAILVNTSRGAVVDTSALVKHLEEGRLGGACLDVFENEKPETFDADEERLYQKLYRMDNVVLSPHVAGWTHESLEGIARVLLSKLDKAGL